MEQDIQLFYQLLQDNHVPVRWASNFTTSQKTRKSINTTQPRRHNQNKNKQDDYEVCHMPLVSDSLNTDAKVFAIQLVLWQHRACLHTTNFAECVYTYTCYWESHA